MKRLYVIMEDITQQKFAKIKKFKNQSNKQIIKDMIDEKYKTLYQNGSFRKL